VAHSIARGFSHGIKRTKKAPVLAAKNTNSNHPFPPKPINGWATVFFSEREVISEKYGLEPYKAYKNN